MKRLPSRRVLLTIVLMGLISPLSSECRSQELENPPMPVADVSTFDGPELEANAPRLPFENESVVIVDQRDFTIRQSDGDVQDGDYESCQSCQSHVVTDAALFPPVKNVNFFGIDRHSCCDEWAGMCDCKNVNFKCDCNGPRPKRSYGMAWFKNKFGEKSNACGCGGSDCGCSDGHGGGSDCGCEPSSHQ